MSCPLNRLDSFVNGIEERQWIQELSPKNEPSTSESSPADSHLSQSGTDDSSSNSLGPDFEGFEISTTSFQDAIINDLTAGFSTIASGDLDFGDALNLSNGMYQANKAGAYVEITEQPQQRGFRFRYACEGKSHGGLPGESSTKAKKTFPTIKVHNYKGPIRIIIRAVCEDRVLIPHPHEIIGKNCKHGIFSQDYKGDTRMEFTFNSLGILNVTKKRVPEILFERLKEEKIKEEELSQLMTFPADYHGVEFTAADLKAIRAEANELAKDISLTVVRLVFEAYALNSNKEVIFQLPPVASGPIHDSKSPAAATLKICRMSQLSGVVTGQDEVYLLCDKVQKDDIAVVFMDNVDNPTWEGHAEFGFNDVHHQFAIVFQTPPYHTTNIQQPVKVQVCLKRISDNELSEPKDFTYTPVPEDPEQTVRKRKKQMPRPLQSIPATLPVAVSQQPQQTGNLVVVTQLPSGEFVSRPYTMPSNGLPSNVTAANIFRNTIPVTMNAQNIDARPTPVRQTPATTLPTNGTTSGLSRQQFATTAQNRVIYTAGAQNLGPSGRPGQHQPGRSPPMAMYGNSMDELQTDFLDVSSSRNDQDDRLTTDGTITAKQVRRPIRETGHRGDAALPPAPASKSKDQRGDAARPPAPASKSKDQRGDAALPPAPDSKSKDQRGDPALPPAPDSKSKDSAATSERCDSGYEKSMFESGIESMPDRTEPDQPKVKQEDEEEAEQVKKEAEQVKKEAEQEAESAPTEGGSMLMTVEQLFSQVVERTIQAIRQYSQSGDAAFMISAHRHLVASQDEEGDNMIHIAVINGHYDSLRCLLSAASNIVAPYESGINQHNNLHQTPLHIAVQTNQEMFVELLMRAGASITSLDRQGNTPIHIAASSGFDRCLRALLETPSPDEHKLRPHTALNQLNYQGYAALHLSVRSSSVNMLRCIQLLVAAQSDVNLCDGCSGYTAMHHAVETENIGIVGYLMLDAGADPNIPSFNGNSPLHLAVGRDFISIAALLVASGADAQAENYEVVEDDSGDEQGSGDNGEQGGGDNNESADNSEEGSEKHGVTPMDLADGNPKMLRILQGESLRSVKESFQPSSSASNVYRSTTLAPGLTIMPDAPGGDLEQLDPVSRERLAQLLDPQHWRILAQRLGLGGEVEQLALTPSPTCTLLDHLEVLDVTIGQLRRELQQLQLAPAIQVLNEARELYHQAERAHANLQSNKESEESGLEADMASLSITKTDGQGFKK